MYLEHRPKEKHCLNNLRPFWGGLNVSDINASKCAEYAKTRPRVAARRDLEVLRAAGKGEAFNVVPLRSAMLVI